MGKWLGILIVIVIAIFIIFGGMFLSFVEDPQSLSDTPLVNEAKLGEIPESSDSYFEIPCGDSHYNAAFILLDSSKNSYTEENVDAIEDIKEIVSKRFSIATRGLASMNTSYPITIMRVDKDYDARMYYNLTEVSQRFYAENPDVFDFLIIYETKDDGNPYYYSVGNNVFGTGRYSVRVDETFGSNGTLIGIGSMSNINRYMGVSINAANVILHEISHQWSAYVDYVREDGSKKDDLRGDSGKRTGGIAHWSYLLMVGEGDLFGGSNWIETSDGFYYRSSTSPSKRVFSDLDLYMMGLISADEVEVMKIVDEDDSETWNEPAKRIIKEIAIEDVIRFAGDRRCIECNANSCMDQDYVENPYH